MFTHQRKPAILFSNKIVHVRKKCNYNASMCSMTISLLKLNLTKQSLESIRTLYLPILFMTCNKTTYLKSVGECPAFKGSLNRIGSHGLAHDY